MYTTKYCDIIRFLDNLDTTSFLIAEKALPIEKLHIQTLVREIGGREITFLSLKNIYIKKEERKKGIMTLVFHKMKDSGLNIMFDDVVNDFLFDFLLQKEFTPFYYEKQGQRIRSAYLLQ